MNDIIIIFCALSFMGYGTSCLFAAHMVAEFERYRLARFRLLTGLLQVMASVGLLIGLKLPVFAGIAAGGLALQMACGLGVRVKIGDPWYLCVPAAFYMLLCSYLAVTLI